jgi:hypothetical protein
MRVLYIVLAVVGVGVLVGLLPDLIRYFKLRSM